MEKSGGVGLVLHMSACKYSLTFVLHPMCDGHIFRLPVCKNKKTTHTNRPLTGSKCSGWWVPWTLQPRLENK